MNNRKRKGAGQFDPELEELFASAMTVEEANAILDANPLHLEDDPDFLVSSLKAFLVEDIWRVMAEKHITRSELAKRMGKSRQYIGRILNENANFTLQTIAAISIALGCKPLLRMVSPEEHSSVWRSLEADREDPQDAQIPSHPANRATKRRKSVPKHSASPRRNGIGSPP